MMKTAIIGASGFVGRHLLRVFRSVYPDTIGTSFSQTNEGLLPFDIRRPNLASLGLRERGHGAVLIASAKSNIAYCEQNEEASRAVNVRGTLELIRQIAELGMRPIFLSSDYVFDGQVGGYDDDARTNPSTIYGRQKELVEQELPRLVDGYLIVRLSKVYGLEKGDGTLLDEIASSVASGKTIRAARDQVFSPTYVNDVASVLLELLARDITGVINVCAARAFSRYELSIEMARAMGLDDGAINRLIEPVALHCLPGMTGRPLNTSMTPSRLAGMVQTKLTPMEDSLRRVAANWVTR